MTNTPRFLQVPFARRPATGWLLGLPLALLAAGGCVGDVAQGDVGASDQGAEQGPAEPVGEVAQAACSATTAGDWSAFPQGDGSLQCVGGVRQFYMNKFGAFVPPASGGPVGACAKYGACNIWVNPANQPSSAVWTRYDWGTATPQLYDMVVFGPASGSGYGHIASVDHMEGGTMYVMDANYKPWSGHKAACVHTVGGYVTYGFYRLKALDVPPNKAPTGHLDTADCKGITGWAQDPDAPDQSIPVHIYYDGPAGGAAKALVLTASQHRDDLCAAIGSCNHGFSTPVPLSLQDGAPHELHAYGIDTAGGNNPEIGAMTLTCAATLPTGIRRLVTTPAVMTAWKFSTLWDLLVVPDAKLEAFPTADDIAVAPVLVQSDDGSPDVWLIDGEYRRLVPSVAVAAAWELDLSTLQVKTKSELLDLIEGPPLRPSPFLIKGSADSVYLLDDPMEPDMQGAGGAGGSTGGAGGSSGSTLGPAGGGAGSGGGAKAGAGGSSSGGKGGSSASSGGGGDGGSGGQWVKSGGSVGGGAGGPAAGSGGSAGSKSAKAGSAGAPAAGTAEGDGMKLEPDDTGEAAGCSTARGQQPRGGAWAGLGALFALAAIRRRRA
jgi:MYXO-CTERM domain-containing protein